MNNKEPQSEELAADGSTSGVEYELSGEASDPFDPASISIESRIVPMDSLLRRLRQGSIRLAPNFQRASVWDSEKSSLLIESLMLRIPLPMFYVSANTDGSWDVVDGLQRLTTIRNFMLGGERTPDGQLSVPEARSFKLCKLEFWGDRFDDKDFSELLNDPANARIVNNIAETELRFTVINPGTPEEVKRNIFKRINTGGMPLTAQEIRHALYQGPATDLLLVLLNRPCFEKVRLTIDDSRMAARELILRFLAFYLREIGEFAFGGMDKFLSDTLRILNRKLPAPNADISNLFKGDWEPTVLHFSEQKIIAAFDIAMERCDDFFGPYAFRKAVPNSRRPPINKALFEVWTTIFARLSDQEFQTLKSRQEEFYDLYEGLLTSDFDRSIGRDAATFHGVIDRYSVLNHLVAYVLGQSHDS